MPYCIENKNIDRIIDNPSSATQRETYAIARELKGARQKLKNLASDNLMSDIDDGHILKRSPGWLWPVITVVGMFFMFFLTAGCETNPFCADSVAIYNELPKYHSCAVSQTLEFERVNDFNVIRCTCIRPAARGK